MTHRTLSRASAVAGALAIVAGPLAGAASAAAKPKVPAPIITAKPSSPTNQTSATFAFTDALAGVTFQCQLDALALTTCTSPKTYTGVANGAHTFRVRARNGAGTQSAATSATWTVDTVKPPVPTVTTAPPAATKATTASIAFTDTEAGVTFSCSLDNAAPATCTSPKALSGLADGTHTFTVTATDAAGNTSNAASATWIVDTTPPAVPSITTGPATPTNATSATFSIFENDAAATLSCSLDGAPYTACTSPVTLTNLSEKTHGFSVRATDAVGNAATAPTYSWTVDLTAPAPPDILTGPDPVTKSAVGHFTFDGHDAVVLQCAVDSALETDFATCTTPFDTASLADGAHTLRVRGSDGATNVSGATPYTWTVDSTPPPAATVTGPAARTNAANASFTISDSENGVTFTCALDGAAAAPCQSGVAYGPLADGEHTLVVTATDGAGNTTPTEYRWIVDSVPPTVSLAKPPTITAPVVATFSEPVRNVVAADFALRVTGTTTNVAAAISCKNAANASTSCTTGDVKTATLQPSRLMPGQYYSVVVNPATTKITDIAANALAPVSSGFRANGQVQENSPALQYGWRSLSGTGFHGGLAVTEHLSHAAVVYTFVGTGVTWYTMTAPTEGKADVYVDGVLKATVNNYASRTTYRVARTVTGLANNTHTLRIQVRGERGSSAGTGTYVTVDAIKTGTTLVTNPPLRYGWRPLGNAAASGGYFTYTDLAGSYVTTQFRGTALYWYTVAGRNQGRATVYIDGVNKGTVDNYAASTTYNVRRAFTGLTDRVHTVKIVVLGQHRAGATGNAVCMDRFAIG